MSDNISQDILGELTSRVKRETNHAKRGRLIVYVVVFIAALVLGFLMVGMLQANAALTNLIESNTQVSAQREAELKALRKAQIDQSTQQDKELRCLVALITISTPGSVTQAQLDACGKYGG